MKTLAILICIISSLCFTAQGKIFGGPIVGEIASVPEENPNKHNVYDHGVTEKGDTVDLDDLKNNPNRRMFPYRTVGKFHLDKNNTEHGTTFLIGPCQIQTSAHNLLAKKIDKESGKEILTLKEGHVTFEIPSGDGWVDQRYKIKKGSIVKRIRDEDVTTEIKRGVKGHTIKSDRDTVILDLECNETAKKPGDLLGYLGRHIRNTEGPDQCTPSSKGLIKDYYGKDTFCSDTNYNLETAEGWLHPYHYSEVAMPQVYGDYNTKVSPKCVIGFPNDREKNANSLTKMWVSRGCGVVGRTGRNSFINSCPTSLTGQDSGSPIIYHDIKCGYVAMGMVRGQRPPEVEDGGVDICKNTDGTYKLGEKFCMNIATTVDVVAPKDGDRLKHRVDPQLVREQEF